MGLRFSHFLLRHVRRRFTCLLFARLVLRPGNKSRGLALLAKIKSRACGFARAQEIVVFDLTSGWILELGEECGTRVIDRRGCTRLWRKSKSMQSHQGLCTRIASHPVPSSTKVAPHELARELA